MKNVKRLVPILAAVMLTVMDCCRIWAADVIKTRLKYDGTMHNYAAEAVYINIDGKAVSEYSLIPIVMNDRILVCARDVFTGLGCEIAWDNSKREVTVSKGKTVIVIPVDKKVIYKNGTAINTDVATKIINDYTMIPIRAVAEGLDCEVGYDSASRTVNIASPKEPATEAAETTTEAAATEPVISKPSVIKPVVNKKDGLVVLWDTISTVGANDYITKREPIEGVDVLCPTWFVIKDGAGTISDISSKNYVDWAHKNGYAVWGLVTNNFDADITSTFLNNEETRKKIINQLVTTLAGIDADGINIDFEMINDEDKNVYVSFMEELAKDCRSMGLEVTVDTFVPAPYNDKYALEEMGDICDYVIMMAYDEHFSTSPQAGSVSSLPWVEQYLKLACEKVKPEKLLLGCPFYTRVWKTDGSNNVISNESYGMEAAEQYVRTNSIKTAYDAETGQNYGELKAADGTVSKVWLEDETSLRARLKLSQDYDCGGCSFWRRGFEDDDAWDIINEYY